MTPAGIVFVVYGAFIMLVDSYAIWRPRSWVEVVERRLIYRRERVVAGVFFLLLGLAPVWFFLSAPAWQVYVLGVLSGLWTLLGALILGFPSAVRNLLLSLGELSDLVLRIVFSTDAFVGLVLVFIGLAV